MQPPQPYPRAACVIATTLLALCASAGTPAPAQSLQPNQISNPTSPSSTLPPTPPTSLAAQTSTTPSTASPAPDPPHYARVTYTNDQLEIHADNSSLNQILHAIAHLTGLKITGGVQDQRVYGAYGPAPTATILATLLDGTGTNILLLEGSSTSPARLILTPRTGEAAPPSPESPIYAAYDNPNYTPASTSTVQQTPQTPPQSAPAPTPQPANNVNGSASNTSPTASTMPTTHSVSLDSVPSPSTTPSTPGIVDAPNPPAPGSTTGATTATPALTPEMVAQKLLQMQQQKTAQPSTTSQPH